MAIGRYIIAGFKWFVRRRILLVLGVILLAPVGVYIFKFGTVVTADHARWAEMGAAMSGIYTPVFALFTLVILYEQLKLQSRISSQQNDHNFVQQAELKIHFYLENLSRAMGRGESGSTIKEDLLGAFERVEGKDVHQLHAAAMALDLRSPEILTSWMGFYTLIAGLGTHKFYPYENSYLDAQYRAVTLLSMPVCVALDNFIFARSGTRVVRKYVFSSVVNNG